MIINTTTTTTTTEEKKEDGDVSLTLTENNYFQDRSHVTFSALKVFSKCETLYQEIFLAKTYEQLDKDYFVYGSLVDALLTETPEYVKENYILVSSKVNVDDALKYENKKQELLNEIEGIEKKTADKIDKLILKKEEALKIETPTPAKETAKTKKVLKLNNDIIALRKDPGATATKGTESRELKIKEFENKILAVKEMGNKSQVTKTMWKNAEETALAIKTHPYWSNLKFNETTSQQVLSAEIDGIKRKGKLDHIKLSPQVEKIYKMFKAKMITREEMQKTIEQLPYDAKWAIITDVKSCFDMEKLEPYNKHYRGQLGFYQDLCHHMLMIPMEQIKCQIFAGDKVKGEFKRAEIFIYTQGALDRLKGEVKAWLNVWKNANDSQKYVSAKEKWGMEQTCFTCSHCRMAPFSQTPGVPVLIDGPRFKGTDLPDADLQDLLIDY